MDQSQEPPSSAVNTGRILDTLRRPRVTLALLAAWAILGVIVEFSSDSFLFDLDEQANGVLAGRALGAEAAAPAALYIFAARNTRRYRFVFWIAFIEQGVAVIANIIHWTADDFGFESVILPIAVAIGFLVLLVPNLVPPEGRGSGRKGARHPRRARHSHSTWALSSSTLVHCKACHRSAPQA